MPFDIASGTYTSADPVLPLDASGTPGVAPPTAVQPGQLSGPTYPGVAPMYADQVAGDEAGMRAAQTAGMDARNTQLAHYQSQALPLGGQIGDAMVVPDVPDNATPPAGSDLYPYAGQEPTPAGVGFYHGDQPTLPE